MSRGYDPEFPPPPLAPPQTELRVVVTDIRLPWKSAIILGFQLLVALFVVTLVLMFIDGFFAIAMRARLGR